MTTHLANATEHPHRLKIAIVVALGALAVLASIVTALEVRAAARAASLRLESDILMLDATRETVTGLQREVYETAAVRRWYATLSEADSARQAAAGATASQAAVSATTAKVYDEIAAQLSHDSALLAAPYYDTQSGAVDFDAYDARNVVAPAFVDGQRGEVRRAAAEAWVSRGDHYVALLAMVAVALFLLGLANVTNGRMRRFFMLTGLLIGIAIGGAAASTATEPIVMVPDAAIAHLGDAQVALSRADAVDHYRELTPASVDLYQAAIKAASNVVAQAPGYAEAYGLRGAAEADEGDALIFSPQTDVSAAQPLLLAGVLDSEKALAAHDDFATWWTVGWSEYLLGNDAQSLAATRRALALAPQQFDLHMNAALALLDSGDVAGARAELDAFLQGAVSTPLATAPFYLQGEAPNLERLAQLRPLQAAVLREFAMRVKEVAVAVQLGLPSSAATAPGPGAAPQIASLTFAPARRDATGEFTAAAPAGGASAATTTAAAAAAFAPTTSAVRATFTLTAAPPGAALVTKVLIDGEEEPGYTLVGNATNGRHEVLLATPWTYAGYSMDPGRYRFEVYVAATLVGGGEFEIAGH